MPTLKIGVELAGLRLPFKQALHAAAQLGADAVEIDALRGMYAPPLSAELQPNVFRIPHRDPPALQGQAEALERHAIQIELTCHRGLSPADARPPLHLAAGGAGQAHRGFDVIGELRDCR